MQVRFQDGVRPLICNQHGILQPEIDPQSIDTFISDPNNLLWLDVDTQQTPDLTLLREEFGFHELALEDAARHHQRPKVEQYDATIFMVFYAVELGGAETGFSLHQIALFVGATYLVTVHSGRLTVIDECAARLRHSFSRMDRTVPAMLYTLLDTIVDRYFPVVDSVADTVEEIEAAIFEQFDPNALQRIFTLKKSLLAMRRVVAPERDALNTLMRREAPLIDSASLLYYQDVYDHLVRVTDAIDTYRELLSSALDAYLSMASNRMNEVMKTLTSWTIPLMAAALLAGIWGMNFTHMPELDERWGYPFALCSMLLTLSFIVVYFHRRRWL